MAQRVDRSLVALWAGVVVPPLLFAAVARGALRDARGAGGVDDGGPSAWTVGPLTLAGSLLFGYAAWLGRLHFIA